MESPGQPDLELPPIPLCVHEVATSITIGKGPGGSITSLTFMGHDENQTPIAVDVRLPACMLDQLSVRLQEYQMAAHIEGIGSGASSRLFRWLRSVILERSEQMKGASGHEC